MYSQRRWKTFTWYLKINTLIYNSPYDFHIFVKCCCWSEGKSTKKKHFPTKSLFHGIQIKNEQKIIFLKNVKILSKVHTLHGRGHSSDIFVVFSSYFLIVERNIHSYRNHFYANGEIFRITSDSNVKFYIIYIFASDNFWI